jgi:hypothetical protein
MRTAVGEYDSMSIETVSAELFTAQENGWLTTIRMHNGEFVEYAEVVEFLDEGDGPTLVRIQRHTLLSGARLVPKAKPQNLTLSHISYATLHPDKVAPKLDDDEF